MSSIILTHTDTPSPATATSRAAVWQLAALVGVLGWAYLSMLRVFADKWLNDPQYSHGLLVPCFSAFLIWCGGKIDSLKPRTEHGCSTSSTRQHSCCRGSQDRYTNAHVASYLNGFG